MPHSIPHRLTQHTTQHATRITQVTHPTKEQVRAYMMARRDATRLPPPTPEEIRRQLDWRITVQDEDRLRRQFYLIPTAYSQMVVQIAIDWLLAPLRRAVRQSVRA